MDLRQFPNSFRVAGLKHVSDNALKGLLEGTRTWKVLIPRLRAVEVLLKGIMNRQRLSHSCVTSEFPCEQKQLEFFSASLKGLRWHAVSAFCIELLKLERILRCLDQWMGTTCFEFWPLTVFFHNIWYALANLCSSFWPYETCSFCNEFESDQLCLTVWPVWNVAESKEIIARLLWGDSGIRPSSWLGEGLLKIQMMKKVVNMAVATLESTLNIWIRFWSILASGPKFTWFDTWPGLITFSFYSVTVRVTSHSQSGSPRVYH